jgi:hypothetical protein
MNVSNDAESKKSRVLELLECCLDERPDGALDLVWRGLRSAINENAS